MTTMTRRCALAGAAGIAATSFAIGRARAAEFTYKIGTDVPETAPLNVYIKHYRAPRE